MRNEDRLILEICKRNGDNSEINLLIKSNTLNWHYFLEIISRHQIAPFVLDRLLKFPLPQPHEMMIRNLGKKAIIKTSRDVRMFENELKRIRLTLAKGEIEFILMKGLSLDFSHLRSIGDLDILIRKEDLIKAINILHQIDYIYVRDKYNRLLNSREKRDINLQLSWNNQFQLNNERTGLLLELHTNLFERQRVYSENLDTLLDDIDLFWKKKQYNEKLNCFTFSHEHSLILMCLHNAIKRSPSNNTFIVKTLVDIDNLVDRGVNWDSFIGDSIRLNVANFVYFSLVLSQRLLETRIPENVLNTFKSSCTKSQLFLTDIHFKCLNSFHSNSIFYSKLYRILSPFVFGKRWKDRIRWLFLIPILFPPRWKMAHDFNLKTSSPLVYFTYLLNPIRWIYIIARNMVWKIKPYK